MANYYCSETSVTHRALRRLHNDGGGAVAAVDGIIIVLLCEMPTHTRTEETT